MENTVSCRCWVAEPSLNSQMETIHRYIQVENFFFLIPISLCEILLRLIDKVKQFEGSIQSKASFDFSLCYNLNTTFFNSFVDQRFLGPQNCV
ncbi:hypothetical protein ACE6H2_012273 [Prunus campanulata]